MSGDGVGEVVGMVTGPTLDASDVLDALDGVLQVIHASEHSGRRYAASATWVRGDGTRATMTVTVNGGDDDD